MIKFERIIDRYVGTILCYALSVFSTKSKEINPQRIIIVKLWAVGESILTLPMIDKLRQKFPKAQIDILTRKRNADTFTGDKNINNVFLLENKPFHLFRKYDLAIDCEPYLNISAILSFLCAKHSIGFDHGVRSLLYTHKITYNDNQHVVQTYADLLKILGINYKPNKLISLKYSKNDETNVNNLLKKIPQKYLVGFCVGAAESGQGWKWQKQKFAELAEELIEKYNASILLVGAPAEYLLNCEVESLVNDKYRKKVFNLAGKTKLKESFALISKCDLFISNDTGPMHIAAAQGVKTIGLFGPNTPIRFGPFGKGNGFVYKPTLPKPCINVHLGSIPDCKNHHHMDGIEVEDVIKEIERIK